jgi:glutamate/tyrosine decarboxylase-like PLP-dependent enzyme
MILDRESLPFLVEGLERLEEGFTDLPQVQKRTDLESVRAVLLSVAERMQDNYPYFHPFYAGQMLKPPHPVARLAYMLSMWVNPNNHALDGGKASSRMEKEAVEEIARMFGWRTHLGHLCSGGTMANLEALWVSGRLRPGSRIVASQQAHYTHERIAGVLGLSFTSVPCDGKGRMDTVALEETLKSGDVGTVVVTMGTTATGAVDSLAEIIRLQASYRFRIHVDAAYGGYFVLSNALAETTRKQFDVIDQVDSIAVDPHKHGLQPYGCGCILFKDPEVGTLYKHDSPYTYFTSQDLHLGEISLECSRAGASAVALWATQRLMPLVPYGTFAESLSACRQAALRLSEKIAASPQFTLPFLPELDIVVWSPVGESASAVSTASVRIFEALEAEGVYLAIARLPRRILDSAYAHFTWDQDHITCLRSCLMKPEHLDWIDVIWEKIQEVTG